MALPAAVRTIQTVYYSGKLVVKINTSIYANSAVVNCIDHMQQDDYNAHVAEVFDSHTGELHAVITRNMTGMKIVYKRELKKGK